MHRVFNFFRGGITLPSVGLDYGHGSNTFPPGKGVNKNGKGYAEHSFNAKLGLEIKKLLEHNGFDVVEGQGANKPEVGLTTRTNLYNRKKVDIVVSIHANAGTSSAEGRCVFYWHSSKNGRKLAQHIVDEIKLAGYSLHGNGLHASKIGSWTNLHITRETHMPAVLIEHGFMTNDKDFELIFGSKQDEYIHDMARADVKAICRYFNKTFKDMSNKTTTSKKKTSTSVKIETGGLNNDNFIKVIDYFRSKGWYGEATINWNKGNPKIKSGGLSPSMRKEYETWLKDQGMWYKVID